MAVVFLLVLLVVRTPLLQGTSECPRDVFALLYDKPSDLAIPEYEKILGKMKRGFPRNTDQIAVLFREILNLPDPADGASQRLLDEIGQIAAGWIKLEATKEAAAIERAILLRRLVAGEHLKGHEVSFALASMHFDRSWFVGATSAHVWRHRAEVALIKEGEQREWGPEMTGDGYLSALSPHNDADGVGPQVLKAMALNPNAKSHRATLAYLVGRPASVFIENLRLEPNTVPKYPLGFVEALTGYLDPEIFPPEKRDPELEKKIRDILPALGIHYKPGEWTTLPLRK